MCALVGGVRGLRLWSNSIMATGPRASRRVCVSFDNESHLSGSREPVCADAVSIYLARWQALVIM